MSAWLYTERKPMKFTVKQKSFCAALSRVQGIASSRATMPILANVLLAASALRPVLHLSATDLEVGYATVIDCSDIEVPGSITVPAKKLYEVVKAAPTGEITVTLNPDNLRVTVAAGTFVTTLAGLDGEEFPAVVPVEGEGFQLDAAALLRLIRHVDYAQSTDATKYNLAGVFLRIADSEDGTRLYAAGSDGHRLAADSVPLPGDPRLIPADLARGIIIPRKGIAELKAIGGEGILILQIAGNNLSISTDNETLTLRLIDGEFPDYQRIIPTTVSATVEVNRQPLMDALNRVSLLAEGKMHPVTLTFADGSLHLESQNVELGEANDRITASVEGNPTARRFNASFLVQALNAWDCGLVQIRLSDKLSPLLISPTCEEEPYAIVMPLRG